MMDLLTSAKRKAVKKSFMILRATNVRAKRIKAKIEKGIDDIEESRRILADLSPPEKKKGKFMTERSIQLKRKNPTCFENGKITLSEVTKRRRRAETFEAGQEIHGGQPDNTRPGEVGLADTVVQRCRKSVLEDVFSSSARVKQVIMPSVYKKSLTSFEKSDDNILRSIAVYYTNGVMGKRKYRATYRYSAYIPSHNNAKTKASLRIEVANCPVPRLVPYNKLMPFIRSIEVGKLYSVRETLCQGIKEEEKVNGMYRSLKDLLPTLAKYYLQCRDNYDITWFEGEENTFHVALGGDGAPFGKDECACAWLVSFLNIGRGVLSSNENFLLFGANCSENCIPVSRFIKNLLQEIKDIEKTTFSVECHESLVDVKFKIAELPNDMKMLAFLAGELSNAATFFSTFADVSSDNMTSLTGALGLTWKPWDYAKRVNVANQVQQLKRELGKKKMTPSTLRSKVTSFIALKKSRQEFHPVIGDLIDKAHVEPLHLKNNACALAHRQVLELVIAISNLGKINSFSEVHSTSPLFTYIQTLRNCNLGRLSKKIIKWVNEGKASNGNSFDYRFTGKDSRSFLHNFMFLISAIESSHQPTSGQRVTLHALAYICLCLRNCVALFNRVDISHEQVAELKISCLNYYYAYVLFFRVNPTIWTIGHVVPEHTKYMKEKYGFGLGINSMEGREAKHVSIARYSVNSVFHSRWELIFRHEFVSLLWLRQRGYNCSKVSSAPRLSYIPTCVEDPDFCNCGLRKEKVNNDGCKLCTDSLRKKIELSISRKKNLFKVVR